MTAKKKTTVSKKKAAPKKATAKKKTTVSKKKAAPKKATAKKAAPKKATSKKAVTKKAVTKKKTTKKTKKKTITKAPDRKVDSKKVAAAKKALSKKSSRTRGDDSKTTGERGSRRRRRIKEKKIVARIDYPESKMTQEKEKIEANYKPLSTSILESNKGKPIFRYNDDDLKMFRSRIESKLALARKELAFLQDVITRTNESDTLDTTGKLASLEDGNISQEREKMSQLAARQISFIEKLEAALMRIENKTYGICRETGSLIEKDRLLAVPHATLSMKAKLKQR